MNEKKKPGVMLYFADFRRPIRCMTDTELGKLFRSVMEYAEIGILPDWYDDPGENLTYVFDNIRQKIDRDTAHYFDVCEKRRSSINRRWRGKDDPEVSEEIQKYTNVNSNEDTNVILTVNENVTGNVNENENEKVEEKGPGERGEEKRAEHEEMTDDRFNTLRNEKINQLLNWRN